jgi:RimJ/RimL family protein N-acetyltransferase
LVLDRYVPSDEVAFVALFQDTQVSRWMGDGPSPEAEDRELFGRIFSHVYDKNLFEVWAVRRDGHLVGHAELKRTEFVDGYELIYALDPAVWGQGQGLGTELARIIASHGFADLGLEEMFATVHSDNSASLVILTEKLGFRHVRDVVRDDGHVTVVLALGHEALTGVAGP